MLAVCAAQNRNAKPAKQPVQIPVQGRSKQPVQANPSAFAFPQFPAPVPVQARKNTPVQAKSDEEEPVRILKQSAILNDDGSYQHGSVLTFLQRNPKLTIVDDENCCNIILWPIDSRLKTESRLRKLAH